jgi:hypothetical protein
VVVAVVIGTPAFGLDNDLQTGKVQSNFAGYSSAVGDTQVNLDEAVMAIDPGNSVEEYTIYQDNTPAVEVGVEVEGKVVERVMNYS